ncbi:MAG: hypothetical protein DHS20C12_17760 [Pseudohongiella sp.]|nr:MAG: hypothetical protein DHS20C12_17760 [Pseudohongiella sp.]
MQTLLVKLHKYTGLIAGLLLSVTGISGSLVVFDRELDELITPATSDFNPVAELASFDLALDNASRAVDNGTRPTRIMVGRDSSAPHIVRFPTPEGSPGPIEVSIHPGNGEVLAVRGWGEYPVTWIYRLHLNFLAGHVGETLVGILGICLLFFCISGVIIWWPKAGAWKRAFSIRRDAGAFRLNFDIHKTVGIYLLPVYLILALTGIEIVWHEPVEKIVSAVLPVSAEPSPLSDRNAASTGGRIYADRVAETASSIFPDSRINRIYLPSSEDAPWRVTFIQPGETWREYGPSSVYIDQYSGTVLDVLDSQNLPAGSTLLQWLFPLHNGDALGFIGRLLIFFAGLMPALLFGTGVYMWLKKRGKARTASSRDENLVHVS